MSETSSDPASAPVPIEPGVQADQALLDRAWLRIGAGLVIAAQAMIFSLAINAEDVEGVAVRWVVHGILLGSALGALFFLGRDLLRESLGALRERRITIDLLFLVTLLGALTGSLLNTIRGVGGVYYEVVSILIVIHTTGKMLGARSRVAALAAVADTRRAFAWARVRREEGERRVPIEQVQSGEVVHIAPGEAIPVDGVIQAGRSFVQEAAMTGEWQPQARGPGEPVWAGSHAIDGDLAVVTAAGERRLDSVLKAVEEARLAPSVLQAQSDRLTAWFLPVVIAAALATGVGWSFHAPWDVAVFNAMAVLLVACPCAMGLATPVAIWGALASLSRWGLVARTGDFIAELARVDQVFFDKTGTLSEENLEVQGWRFAPGWEKDSRWLQAAVSGVEAGLRHPIALALGRGERRESPVAERRLIPGVGVEAQVEGRRVAVGESVLGVGAPGAGEGVRKEVHVFVDGQWAATVSLGEAWRPGLSEIVKDLESLGVRCEVLSGDPLAAKALSLGCSVQGGLSAADKVRCVEEARRAGRRVLLVGDGVNDAAAMASADVAIALQGGTELAHASAGAIFNGADLRFLREAILLARATVRGIRRNLLFAFGYNVVGMALAGFGYLHPVAAALLMVGSSAVVSVQALRSVGGLRAGPPTPSLKT